MGETFEIAVGQRRIGGNDDDTGAVGARLRQLVFQIILPERLADRIGTIAAGKNADLFIVNGNPAAKIDDVENVVVVFKDGVGYDSAKLIRSVKGRFGEY